MINNINIDVILASHAHQVPQVGLPQIDPVTKAINVNNIPDGAILLEIKIKFLFLKINTKTDKMAIEENIPRDIHAAGT